jgi:pimeloyl-ACP methyl ester carboxylesterase
MPSALRPLKFPGHPAWLTLLVAGLALGAASEAWAQAKTNRKPPAEDKMLATKSGLNIRISYFPSTAGEDAPVAVLLHGKSGVRIAWKDFAARLQQETDFAVITVDLSGHGESGSRTTKAAAGKKNDGALRPIDYQAMVADDLEAVKRFIFDEHQKKKLNMSKLALVGADFSTAVAVAYADFDWQKKRYDDAPTPAQRTPRGEDVRGLILLSPEEQVPGLTVAKSIARLRTLNIPVMIGVSKGDTFDKGNAKKIYDLFAPKASDDPEKQFVYLLTYDGKLRGTDLLGQQNQKVETNMLNFLQKHVANFPVDWQDRRSRLERDDGDEGKK